MKEGLWRIVTGEETAPTGGSESERAKFASRQDKALATVVLSVDTSLLYLIRNPEDPAVVWKKLADQFEKKTWATRLGLRRKLHSLRLKEGDSAQVHIKAITELFDALSVAGETISEEDRVVYLLASLPETYNVLVTALEAHADVPKLEVVTERILHQEWNFSDKSGSSSLSEGALTSCRFPKGGAKVKCHHCGKLGHIKKFCRELKAQKERRGMSEKTAVAAVEESETPVLISIANQALSVSSPNEQCAWIVDSGATSHMCRDSKLFTTLYQLEDSIDVVLGDGRALTAVGRGEVKLDMVLPSGQVRSCILCDVLYVPELSYNLISVAKASLKGKIIKFTKSVCYMLDKGHKMVAKATRVGGLYLLDYKPSQERASFAEQADTKEDVWHKRFGHLGVSSLQRLARENLVDGFVLMEVSNLPFVKHVLKQSSTEQSLQQVPQGLLNP